MTCTSILQVRITFNSKKVEATCCIYEGKDAFLWLPTSFGKSILYNDAVICTLDRKQSDLGTGRGSYTVVLVVSPLVSLMIAKFIGLSECLLWQLFFQLCTYTTLEYLVRILLHMDKLCTHYNFEEIFISGNGCACTSQSIPPSSYTLSVYKGV